MGLVGVHGNHAKIRAMAKLKNELTWSRSRASQFDECPRRYWFTYYGSWGGWESNAPPRVREAYILKNLQTRWMWVGDLVHGQVEKCLRSARAGELLPLAKAVEELLETMRAGFRQSRAGEYRVRPKKACGLVEHEYKLPVSDEQWGEVAEHMKTCLGGFYASPYPAKLPGLPRGAWLPIEELDSFVFEGTKVWVVPDFAYKTSETTVEIIDWKTGRKEAEVDPVQLACYALYALGKGWAPRPEDVTTTEYNLGTGLGRESRMDEGKLEEVRGRMRSSISAMKALLDDVAGNVATESKFPVTTDAATCRGCNYRKICGDSPAGPWKEGA